jgi:hypothetical protein
MASGIVGVMISLASMIIGNLNLIWFALALQDIAATHSRRRTPDETDAVLSINPNAILALRSPCRASKRFDGGLSKSLKRTALSSLVSALFAASAKPSNSRTRSPARNRVVAFVLHPRIAMRPS